jgi:hypothetical protein
MPIPRRRSKPQRRHQRRLVFWDPTGKEPEPYVVNVERRYMRTDIGGSMDGPTLRNRARNSKRLGPDGRWSGRRESIGFKPDESVLLYDRRLTEEEMSDLLASYREACESYYDADRPVLLMTCPPSKRLG